MIIVLKQEAKNEDVTRIEQGVKEKGLEAHISKGENQTIIGLVGDTTKAVSYTHLTLPTTPYV